MIAGREGGRLVRLLRRHAVPLGIFVFFGALYVVTCARTLQGGDASEFMAIAARGGVAHPPGYPLFCLLIQIATDLLPVGTAAFRASVVSALMGAGCLALLCDGVVRLTGRPLVGVLAAGALGLSTTFWRYCTVAEVFSMAALTAMLVLAVAIRISQGWRGGWAQLCLGLAVATGIANHHSVVLLAPLAVWAFVTGIPSPRRFVGIARSVACCGAGLSTGFLMYLRLMLPGGAWRWGETNHLDGLLRHFLRVDYGTLQLALSDDVVHPWAHPVVYAGQSSAEFVWVFAVMAVVGLVVAFRRGPHRGLLLALAAAWLLSGPLFLARFNLAPEGMKLAIASRFYLVPNSLLAVFVGVGVASILQRAGARLRTAGYGLAALALVVAGVTHYRSASHANWTVLEDYVWNTLDAVEPGALVIGASDNLFFGVIYAQAVQERRTDVVYIQPHLLTYDWYRRWVAANHPDFEPQSLAQFIPIPGLIANSLGRRPIYLAVSHAGRETLLDKIPPVVPYSAVLFRVLSPHEVEPSPTEVEQQMDGAVSQFVMRSDVETPHQWIWSLERSALDQYALCYLSVARAHAGNGDQEGERRCVEKARAFSPPVTYNYETVDRGRDP